VNGQRRNSAAWTFAWLALLVAAGLVMLVLQLGSWRSERVDRARPPEANTVRDFAPGNVQTEPRPAPGEYVYVEKLPEALTKVPPEYPDEERQNRIEGTVIVQALVGRDGRVKEAKITQSVPGLDQAALAAITQWTFRPAESYGKPVAVWVAVPVKFSLK
jgi:TonB family protein